MSAKATDETGHSSTTALDSACISPTNVDLGNVVTREDIDLKPWKYIGYPSYATLVASEDDFFILRRFARLNVRIALLLQDEIVMLEDELAAMDHINSKKSSEDIHNGSFREDQPDRKALLGKIRLRLKDYNEFVLQQAAMKRFRKAPKSDVQSLCNWHFNHDYAAISPEEQRYLDHDDLIGVVPKDKLPLREFIDKSRRLRTLSIWRMNDIESEKEVTYYSEKRKNTFVTSLIVGSGGILLLAPLWILYALQSTASKLAVITVFVAIFLVTLSFTLVTKPLEALGATAAYAAVLTVFLQVGAGN
ncbi:hypothetical protein GGR57DRAFT_467663 [Xylariaceae sp. FL1272]|nr:hypothetical protein GGR57DRAFT_467663 [Xylariaceae sp. FL1272]